jgi:DNA processing protein
MPNKTYLLPGEPERLLRLRGNPALLGLPSVAIVGSRKVSLKGLDAARDCAAQLARAGVNVVSGYAKGVDTASHMAALEAGGTTTLVLATGLSGFWIKDALKPIWDWDRVLVVSEFEEDEPWAPQRAFQRNGTIVRLSRAVIVAEAALISGTMNTVRQCLKREIPLFAVIYENMDDFAQGNAEAVRLGANRLLKSRLSRRARLDPVFQAIQIEGAAV